jgi:hypothetical protein
MIAKEQLEQNGYKRFLDNLKTNNEHYQGTYSKAFNDSNDRTKFYLTFDTHYYDTTDTRYPEDIRGNFYATPYARLTSNGLRVNIEAILHKQDLQEVEQWFNDAWAKLGCDYYD